jgi:hypothetical protein
MRCEIVPNDARRQRCRIISTEIMPLSEGNLKRMI